MFTITTKLFHCCVNSIEKAFAIIKNDYLQSVRSLNWIKLVQFFESMKNIVGLVPFSRVNSNKLFCMYGYLFNRIIRAFVGKCKKKLALNAGGFFISESICSCTKSFKSLLRRITAAMLYPCSNRAVRAT